MQQLVVSCAIAVDATPRPAAAVPDGRTERGRRTRDAVVEAMLDLLSSGEPRPTAKQIAERAGISLRSVYVHFEDLEGLFRAAHERSLSTITESWTPIPVELALPERLEAFCRQRCEILESMRGIALGATLHEPMSHELVEASRAMRRLERDEIEAAFAPELDRLDESCRTRRLEAAAAMCGATTWHTLRVHHDLDAETARGVVCNALQALIESPS